MRLINDLYIATYLGMKSDGFHAPDESIQWLPKTIQGTG